MKRNSGNIGAKRTTSITTASGVHDTFDAYNARRLNIWPPTFKYVNLEPNSGTILENSQTTFTLSTENILSNTTLYWTILHGTTVAGDFFSSVTSGSFTINSLAQLGTFIARTSIIANPSKVAKTFQIQIRTGSTSGPVVYTSGTYSIPACTCTVSWSSSTINENSQSSFLQVTLGNIGTYTTGTASITYSGTASSTKDIDFSSISTGITIGFGTNQVGVTTIADGVLEGTETLTAEVSYFSYSNSILGSATLTITDSSTPITATITPTTSSVNEGSSVTFNISITSGNFSSGTLYWTLVPSGTVTDGDFSSPSSAISSGGSVSISGSAGSVTFTLNSDLTTESAAESFQFRLRSGSTSGAIIATSSSVTINDTSQTPATPIYTRVSGTKAPTLGAGGAATYPPSGWTGLQNASADDANRSVNIPTFTISSTNYLTVFVGSNTYLTFGNGSTAYSSLSASNPNLNKIHIGAADNSYQRVSTISSGSNYTRIRYEGNGSTSGTVGSPGIVYEATFFNQASTGNVPVVEILVGNHNRTTGQAMIASTSTAYAIYTLTANQSYVFVGNSTGTSWTVYSGSYMSGTGY
jgi:hypothetical protein